MTKYKLLFHYSDGTDEEDDNDGRYYDTEEQADAAGLDGLSAYHLGGEILEMSNPGDYPYDEDAADEDTFEILEVEVDD